MAGKKKGDDKSKAKESGGKGGKGGKAASDSKSTKQKGAQAINVRHILCEKHSKKEEALAKLKAGVPFNQVAQEFSEDKARQGGALGWKNKGTLLPEFETVAYALTAVKSPKLNGDETEAYWGEAKTSEGYHIIWVEDRK